MAKQIAISARGLRATDHGPVRLKLEPVGSDQAKVLFSVDYSRAPVPDLSYFADYCDVRRRRSWVDLIFGKLTDSGTELRTKVEIAFPDSFFSRQLWGSSGSLRETMTKFVGENAITPFRIPESKEKVQTFRANNVFIALQGEESVLDFYYLSAKELYMVRNYPERESTLLPVIRVCTDTFLLEAFFRLCEPLVAGPEEGILEAADTEESV